MEFDELKKNWGAVKAPDNIQSQQTDSLISRLKKANRKILFNNFILSVILSITIVFLGLIWSWYPGRTWFFYGSILGIQLLIIISIIFHWRRLLFWNTPDFSLSNLEFLDKTLKRLKRSVFLRKKFLPAYHIILFISLMFYTYDLTRGETMIWQIGLFAGNIIFIGLVLLIAYKSQSKKQKDYFDNLVQELENIKSGLNK